MSGLTETTLEKIALDWFESLEWQTALGPNISPDLPAPQTDATRQAGGLACERKDYNQVVLIGRLQVVLENINPNIPAVNRRSLQRELRSMVENGILFRGGNQSTSLPPQGIGGKLTTVLRHDLRRPTPKRVA